MSRAEFSAAQARDIVGREHFALRPGVYWADFLVSWTIGVAAFAAVPLLGWLTLPAALAFVVSVLALYRAGAFVHEVVHFRKRRELRAFRAGWNVLCGIPLLVPAFMYDHHWDHHAKRHFATEADAEYVPFARRSPWAMVGFLAITPLAGLAGVYRFGVLTPLSWAVPRLRRFVYERASALKIDAEYVGRPPRTAEERRRWLVQEVACVAWLYGVVALAIAGVVPLALLAEGFLVFGGISVVNGFRLLGAHRYRGDGDEMSFVEQMLDSVNYPRRRWVNELWAPVGLRLHALHHVLPGLPYHAYPEAHMRLVDRLPLEHPYRQTEMPTLTASLRRLWRDARDFERGGRAGAPEPAGMEAG